MLASVSISTLPVLAEEPSKFFTLEQAGTTYVVEAIQGTDSASDFYSYVSASGQTPFMKAYESKIYLYQEDEGQLSLMIHHNMEGVGSRWMRVDFNLELEGLDDVDLGVFSDDPNHKWNDRTEFGLDEEPEGKWMYRRNSDGGYIEGLPDREWSITITPDFDVEGTYDSLITAWEYLTDSTEISLNMEEPITISSSIISLEFPEGSTAVPTVQLFFEDEDLPDCIPALPDGITPYIDVTVVGIVNGIVQVRVSYEDVWSGEEFEETLRLFMGDCVDFNLDGTINGKDLSLIKKGIKKGEESSPKGVPFDVDNNGEVNQVDIDIVKDYMTKGLIVNRGRNGRSQARLPWLDITTEVDTENNFIYGETDHFSIFRGR